MKINEPNHTATEALKMLLEDYRQRREAFSVYSDYDAIMHKMRSSYGAKINTLDEPLKSIAQQLFDVADQGFFLFQVIEWKIDYLASALLHAIDTSNPLSLANNARALIEHIASLTGIGAELDRLERSLKGQQSEKIIKKSLGRTKSYLNRAYYGRSPKIEKEKSKQAPHINVSLKVFEKEVPNIKEIYDFLNEYVHPNYGSNILVSSGTISSGRLNPPEDFHRDTLDKLRRICSYCMIYLKDQAEGYLSAPIRLQGLLDHCFVRGAKLTNVFSVKAAKPKGDGKSQKTAFYFPKARTAQEAIKLTYEYFESEGYELTGMKEIGGIEQDYICDIHHTNKGKVWVKIPQIKIE